jgi:hypothetical protein
MFPECSLNVPWMFPECSLNVHWMFYSWETSFGLVNPRTRYSCLQVVFCVNLGTFFKVLLAVGMEAHGRPLNSPWMFPECSLNVPWMFPECSLNVPWMFPAGAGALCQARGAPPHGCVWHPSPYIIRIFQGYYVHIVCLLIIILHPYCVHLF